MATEITIKDTLGNIRFVTPINEGAKRVRKLMGEDHVSFSFSVDTLIEFRLGDYADIEGEGRFCLIDMPYPSLDADTGGYTYELQLDAQYRKWANKLFKYLPQKGGQECSWSLTATIAIHAEQVLNAVNALGEQSSDFLFNGVTKWECAIDASVDAVVAKAITFDNINILDGISAIAEEFECEWWVTDNVIYFGKCELGDTEVELSRHSNVTEISRSETDENVANRIYAFGSTENLPSTYRKDLIFDVTNSVASSNGVRISDASRPLSHEWFDSDLLVDAPGAHIDLNEDNWLGLVGDITTQNGLSQSEVPVVTKTQELSPLVAGKYQFGLSLFEPFWNVALDSPVTGLSAEVIIYGTYSNDQLFRFTDKRFYPLDPTMFSTHEDKTFEIPKTMKVDGIEENITVKKVFAVVLISLRFSSYGTTTYSISTSDKPLKLFLPDRVYGVRNITIEILNGNLKGETITNVVYNPDFALDKSEANVLVVQAPIEDLPIGTTFKITNIKESLVPNSYYSEYYYANDDEDNYEVINAVADGRLRMPLEKGDYIDAYRYDDNNERVWLGEDGYDTAHEMPLAEVIEDVVIFDDVKPDHTFEITKSWYIQEEKKDEDNEPYTVYRFFFYDEIFDEANQFKQIYILEGKDLKIRFSSGKLNGMEFDLGYKNEEGNPTRWEIIVNEDATLPSTLFMAEEGDTFTMSGLNVQIIKEQYIDDAETRLFDMAFEYVIESNIDASSYTCTMKSEIMSGYEEGIGVRPENALSLGLGQRVRLKESIFFKNGRSSRIIGYEYPLDYPFDNPQYTVGTKAAYSRFGDIEDKLDSLSLSIGSSKGGGLSSYTSATSLANYVIGTNDTTPATDANVYSALRSIAEFIGRKSSQIIDYVWTFLNGVRVGQYVANASGASINANGEAEVERLVSRTAVDSETMNANISVLSPHVSTADFVNNGLLGTGGGFYQLNGLTYAEFDYLTARRGMTVFELLIQEYRSIGGAFIVSPANGEVVNVVRWTNEDSGLSGYNLTIKDFANNPQFVVGDLVRCAKWDADNDTYIGYWVEVEAVNKDTGVISIWETDLNGAVPQVGDKLVQMGNTTDTTRQGCIEISTVNSMPRITVYDGITSPVIDAKKNIKCLQGALTGFVDPYTNEVLSGYGIWGDNAYLHGEFILATGKSVTDTINEVGTGRNLLLATNQGATNWLLSSSLTPITDYYTIGATTYQNARGVSFVRKTYGATPTWEVMMFALRPEMIVKDKTYHLSFDMAVTSNAVDFLVALATASGGEHLYTPLLSISHVGDGEYTHYDLEITANASGDDAIVRYVYISTKADSLGNWDSISIANMKFEEGLKATDWTAAPEDTDTKISQLQSQQTEFKVSLDEISATVSENYTDLNGRVTTNESAIKQNADSISLKVSQTEFDEFGEKVTATGIDIENKTITATTDNFLVKNNAGETTAAVDAFGNFSASALIAKHTDKSLAITANYQYDRALKFYYEGTNMVQFEIGWNGDSLMRYYDENGVMLWKIGSEKSFVEPSDTDNEPTEILLWKVADSGTDWTSVINIASDNVDHTADAETFYQGRSSSVIATTKNFAEGTYVNGYYTKQAGLVEVDGGKHWRYVTLYENGKPIESEDVLF